MAKLAVPAKKTFEFEIEGHGTFQMRRPTIQETEIYIEKWTDPKATAKERNTVLFKHLDKLGLPEKVGRDLENEQIEFIIEALSQVKKN